jgi:DNA (cytosine-5)-methyltransferase 3A
MVPEIDLLIGGSPCQDLSIAKKDRKGLSGDRSGLFWDYVRILKEVKPKYFVLENVASMAKADKDLITETMGVEPVMFNASLVSAQMRKRLFWTNIAFELPEDRGIVLKDILQSDAEVDERMVVDGKAFCLTSTYHKVSPSKAQVVNSIERKQRTMVKVGHIGNSDAQANRVYSPDGKSPTLSANGGGLGAKTGLYKIEEKIRKLTPIECERLQGLPDDYTAGISKTQRYKCLGNAFNVDVVASIVKNIVV